jgi:hypothetical protein
MAGENSLHTPIPTSAGNDIPGISTSMSCEQKISSLLKFPPEIWSMIIKLAYQPRIVELADIPFDSRNRRKLGKLQPGETLFSHLPIPALVNVSKGFRELIRAQGYDIAFDTGSDVWSPPIWFNFRYDILCLTDPSWGVGFFRDWNTAQDRVTKSLARVENLLLNAVCTRYAELSGTLDGQEKYFRNLKRLMIVQTSGYDILAIKQDSKERFKTMDDCTCMEIHDPLSNPSTGDDPLKELIGCAGKIGIIGKGGKKQRLVEHTSKFIAAYKQRRVQSRRIFGADQEAIRNMLPDFNLQTSGSGIIVSHVVILTNKQAEDLERCQQRYGRMVAELELLKSQDSASSQEISSKRIEIYVEIWNYKHLLSCASFTDVKNGFRPL